jgi:hypothetical protein
MKFNRLGAFTLGVVITAVSVGAVSFVNAAGNRTLKACANKTTGVMRYISKGSCKKTETSLSWNQIGPTGLPGAAGTNGTDGAAGTKGDTGAVGTNGLDGKALYVVDATGKTLGQVLGDGSGGLNQLSPTFLTLVGNRIWVLSSNDYSVQGNGGFSDFSNQTCTIPLGSTQLLTKTPSQTTFGDMTPTEGQTYIASSKFADDSDLTKTVYTRDEGICRLKTTRERRGDVSLWNLEAITPPTYTAPLTIVAK